MKPNELKKQMRDVKAHVNKLHDRKNVAGQNKDNHSDVKQDKKLIKEMMTKGHIDKKADEALIRKMVKKSALK